MDLFERMRMEQIEITVNELKSKIMRLERRIQELEATTYPKKMTKENIEEKLGYKIDIID